MLQGALSSHRRIECIRGGGESGAKGIADGLEDEPMPGLNQFTHDGMMACQQDWQLIRIVLGQFGAAFDICEEKGHRSGRGISVHGLGYTCKGLGNGQAGSRAESFFQPCA